MRENFGNKIKELRRAKEMTIYDLAKKSNVSTVEISGIENGRRKPQVITLRKIADALECDFEELYHLIY